MNNIIGKIVKDKNGGEIRILNIREHTKASEVYVDIHCKYFDGKTFNWSIPIEYRRTGVHLSDKTDDEIIEYLVHVCLQCHPSNWNDWLSEQLEFWKNSKANVTKPFFDVLASSFTWHSVNSDFPSNPNWARRIQDLKELGYTISTNLSLLDVKTGRNSTHLMLLPLKRGPKSGYETWTPRLKDKFIRILGCYDAYEAKQVKKETLIPDHKFPEIRWDENTKRDSLENLTDSEIRRDFQLLNNQRNLQKREVCRLCYQTNKRGYPYGIQFFYQGGEDWQAPVKKGKDAEIGCIGCGWYDLETWRQKLRKVIAES